MPSNPLSRILLPRVPGLDVLDRNVALGFAKQSLAKCISQHKCRSGGTAALPARVVYAGSHNDDVKIVIPGTRRDLYICLSHCGGAYSPCGQQRTPWRNDCVEFRSLNSQKPFLKQYSLPGPLVCGSYGLIPSASYKTMQMTGSESLPGWPAFSRTAL